MLTRARASHCLLEPSSKETSCQKTAKACIRTKRLKSEDNAFVKITRATIKIERQKRLRHIQTTRYRCSEQFRWKRLCNSKHGTPVRPHSLISNLLSLPRLLVGILGLLHQPGQWHGIISSRTQEDGRSCELLELLSSTWTPLAINGLCPGQFGCKSRVLVVGCLRGAYAN